MLLILQATPAQIARAKEVYTEDHAEFYGQPHGFKISECAAAHALFIQAGMPEDHELNHGLNLLQNGNFGWLTSGGERRAIQSDRGNSNLRWNSPRYRAALGSRKT